MTVRKLSPTGDFTFGASQLNFISDSPDTVAQVIQTSLLLWLGEWYLDLTAGMPWIQGVFGKHNQSTADVTVQDYILQVLNVTDISQFSSISQADQRKYTASMVVDTSFGKTPIQIANSTLF